MDIVSLFKQSLDNCISEFVSCDISAISSAVSIARVKKQSLDEKDFRKKLLIDQAMMVKELMDLTLQYYAARIKNGLIWDHRSSSTDFLYLSKFMDGKTDFVFNKHIELFKKTTDLYAVYRIFSQYKIKENLMDSLTVTFFESEEKTKIVLSKYGNNSLYDNIDLINRLLDDACIYCMGHYCDTNNYHKIDNIQYITHNSSQSVVNGSLVGNPSGMKIKPPSKFAVDFIENMSSSIYI